MNIIVQKGKEKTKLPQVVRAAIHLFVKQGVDATTTKDIAKAAGVAEGALYRHFKSKEDLAWNIFSTHLNQFSNELMGKVLSEKKSKDRVRIFVSECFSAFEEDADLFSYLILSEHKEFKNYPVTHTHPGQVVMKMIEEGQKQGDIREGEPYLLGAIFIGSIIRICLVKMYGNLSKDLRRSVEAVSEMLWATLKISA